METRRFGLRVLLPKRCGRAAKQQRRQEIQSRTRIQLRRVLQQRSRGLEVRRERRRRQLQREHLGRCWQESGWQQRPELQQEHRRQSELTYLGRKCIRQGSWRRQQMRPSEMQ